MDNMSDPVNSNGDGVIFEKADSNTDAKTILVSHIATVRW